MQQILNAYRLIAGDEAVDALASIASFLKSLKIVHVNSTREGGGVAEILSRMVPLTQLFGIDVQWLTIQGNNEFFQCTKMFHNLLQGQAGAIPEALLRTYEKVSSENAKELKHHLQNADCVLIHDPQPLALLPHFPNRKGKWFWRCHIDLSSPSLSTWNYLKQYVNCYDASIFSLREFIQKLSHPTYVISPSIDPLSDKNIPLNAKELQEIFSEHSIDIERPSIVQISRFDRFKDPLGVIDAYKIVKAKYPELQLILAGSSATDDPEGKIVLEKVRNSVKNDPDIHILLLPPTAHRQINALQRGATIVLQKSLKEGFGLTVAEALWKEKPVIGGNTGGIRLQIIDQQTGFLVNSPLETAHRIEQLLQNPKLGQELGNHGKQLVKKQFLITRQLKDYLTVMAFHLFPNHQKLQSAIQKLE